MTPSPHRRFWIIAAPSGVVAGALALGSDPAGLRWVMEYALLLAVGVVASSLPHLALPDSGQYLVQLANMDARALAARAWRQFRVVPAGLLAPGLVLALWPPLDTVRILRGVAYGLTVWAVARYALLFFHRLGPLSQEWSEGKRGAAYRWIKENTPYGLPLPDGLAPAFYGTVRIYSLGLVAHLVGKLLEARHPALALLPASLLLAWASLRWQVHQKHFDRYYYASNAFFREVLAAGRLVVAAERPLPYESLYWIPARWRPAAWLGLLQLDRRFPLGRLVALGQVVWWMMLLQEAPPAAASAWLAAVVLAQKAISTQATLPPAWPVALATQMASESDWRWIRFWIQVRWTPALMLSLALVASVTDTFSISHVAAWTAADLVLSALVAVATPLFVPKKLPYAG